MSTILIHIAVGAGIFLAGVVGGIKWHAGQDAIKQVAAEVNQRATERMRRQNANTAAVGFEKARVEIRTKYVPITEEVERVVTKVEYRDRMCLDADGVRVVNRALSGIADDSRSTGPALPASAPVP